AFPLAAVAGPLAASEALAGAGERLVRFTQFTEGSLVHIDPTRFKASEELRERVLNEVRKRLPGPEGIEPPFDMSKEIPLRSLQGDTLRISYDFQIILQGEFFVSGVFDLETSASVLRDEAPNLVWRLADIRLQTVKSFRVTQGERGPPRGPLP